MINTSEISTAKTTDPYDIYWWLAPRYFEELTYRPKHLVAIEWGTTLLITLRLVANLEPKSPMPDQTMPVLFLLLCLVLLIYWLSI